MRKIAFTMVCTDEYVHYLEVFLKSLLINNPWFRYPIYIFTRPEKLSTENKQKIIKLYDNTIFYNVDVENYVKHNKGNVRYYSIEAFNIKGFDKIICPGPDMLCLGDIKELCELKVENVTMTKELRRKETFNNGCMNINGKLCNEKIYNDLLEADYSNDKSIHGTDQKLYCLYFRGKIELSHQKWNTLVSEIDFIKFEDIKFLHYIYKPDDPNAKNMLGTKLINLWNEYKNKELS